MSAHLDSAGSEVIASAADNANAEERATIVCHEVFDETSQPSEAEVVEYALKLGIDPYTEPHLLCLAKEGLLKELPSHWKPCWDETVDDFYYFNFETGQSQWQHPLDDIYRQKVLSARAAGPTAHSAPERVTADQDATELSADTSDILSPQHTMDLRPPAKLAPLPAVGSSGSKSMNKKALPPLRRMPSLGSNIAHEAIKNNEQNHDEDPPPPAVQPRLAPPRSLNLAMKGSSLLKASTTEVEHSVSDDDFSAEAVLAPKIVSSSGAENVRSILKQSSPTKKSPSAASDKAAEGTDRAKALKAAALARDRKRIQFADVKNDLENLHKTLDPSPDASGSNGIPKPLSNGEINEEDEEEDDGFLTLNQLGDPSELAPVVGHGAPPAKEQTDTVSSTGSDNSSTTTPKGKTRLSKILSGVNGTSPESHFLGGNGHRMAAVADLDEDEEEAAADAVLESVRFNDSVLLKMQEKRLAMVSERSADSVKRDLIRVGEPLTPANPQKGEEEAKQVLEHFSRSVAVDLESEKGRVLEAMQQQMAEEMERLRHALEVQRTVQEQDLRQAMEAQLRNMRLALEEDLRRQRSVLAEEARAALEADMRRLDEERRQRLGARERHEHELEEYAATLRDDLERRKAELRHRTEAEAAKPSPDAAAAANSETAATQLGEILRAELHQQVDRLKDRLREDFSSDVRELEADLQLLRSQIRPSPYRSRSSSARTRKRHESSEDDDEVEEEGPHSEQGFRRASLKQQQAGMRSKHQSMTSMPKSRSTLNLDSDAESFHGSSYLDMSRSVQNLHDRVIHLERSLRPLALPYAAPPIHVQPNIPVCRITTVGAWTVDEHISRAKSWLRQRQHHGAAQHK